MLILRTHMPDFVGKEAKRSPKKSKKPVEKKSMPVVSRITARGKMGKCNY